MIFLNLIIFRVGVFMFWDVFYNLCVANETSPNAVCKKLDLSNATATSWKKSATLPNGETLLKLADYFGCSVDYLLDRPLPTVQDDHIKKELLIYCDKLNQEGKSRLLQYAEDLSNINRYLTVK